MVVNEYPVMEQSPWWGPGEADLGWDEPLPDVVMTSRSLTSSCWLRTTVLSCRSGVKASATSRGSTRKFSAELLGRLAAWQRGIRCPLPLGPGWEPDEIRDQWASEAAGLAAGVRTELGTGARLVVKLWGLDS
jgi:hypothetical protein